LGGKQAETNWELLGTSERQLGDKWKTHWGDDIRETTGSCGRQLENHWILGKGKEPRYRHLVAVKVGQSGKHRGRQAGDKLKDKMARWETRWETQWKTRLQGSRWVTINGRQGSEPCTCQRREKSRYHPLLPEIGTQKFSAVGN